MQGRQISFNRDTQSEPEDRCTLQPRRRAEQHHPAAAGEPGPAPIVFASHGKPSGNGSDDD